MKSESFYDIVDQEIIDLNKAFKNNVFLSGLKTEDGKKSFGFLLWFLKNYLPNTELTDYENLITEGEGDNSCDLIFSNIDNEGKEVYYVVQAKWFQKSNINKTNEISKEVRACLSDFRLILSGRKSDNNNIKFAQQYVKFINHKRNNGKVKFLFVCLCQGVENVNEHIADFVSELIFFELLDLNKLKHNYIEIEFKEIRTHNPIETPYVPKTEFDLNFEEKKCIKIPNNLPHEAHLFLIKPIEIYRLFSNYGFSLFYKNIRNPLTKSLFNAEISNTIINNPLNFWYFNNGITAITDNVSPFDPDNGKVTLKGIQVINGAQTVYSIFQAYQFSTATVRESMDNNALISLRVLKTGGRDFDLNVTRYTNSQNPINDRDFHSNDDIQQKLQKLFYKNTNIWYETRRGEYRKKIRGVLIISNELYGQTYLAYSLQDPFNAKQNSKNIFKSSITFPTIGLYEKIFNSETDPLEMYLSYLIFLKIERNRKDFKKRSLELKNIAFNDLKEEQKELIFLSFIQYASFDILALFNTLFIAINSENIKGAKGKLKNDVEGKNIKTVMYYDFILKSLTKFIKEEREKNNQLVYSVWFKSKDSYSKMKERITNDINKLSLIDKQSLKY